MKSLIPIFGNTKGESEGSLACQFTVEAAQCNSKGLNGAHRIAKIHREHVFCNAPKLHDDVVGCQYHTTINISFAELNMNVIKYHHRREPTENSSLTPE